MSLRHTCDYFFILVMDDLSPWGSWPRGSSLFWHVIHHENGPSGGKCDCCSKWFSESRVSDVRVKKCWKLHQQVLLTFHDIDITFVSQVLLLKNVLSQFWWVLTCLWSCNATCPSCFALVVSVFVFIFRYTCAVGVKRQLLQTMTALIGY